METIKKWSSKLIHVLTVCVLSIVLSVAFSVESEATNRTQAQAVEWVKSQVGKSIDADGVYGAQCVDLILAYYDYLGVSRSSGNGADYAWNALPSGWQRLQGATPQAGDILVYSGNANNKYGHVAIFESTNSTYHQNFDAHPYVERVTKYSYKGLSNPYWGVIRPNWGTTPTPPPTPSSFFTALWADNIGTDDARINATINLTYIQSCGFYLGTSASNMSKVSEDTYANVLNIWFDLKDYRGALSSGTTYYYKVFIVVNGTEYCTDVQSFTTAHTHSHSSKITKAATCTTKGIRTYTCSCGDNYTEEIPMIAHKTVIDKAVEATCTKTGLTEGNHCEVCKTVFVEQKVIPVKNHTDVNFDGKCDSCGINPNEKVPDEKDPEVKDCSCMCHKTGFMKIIYSIVKFFWKIFGVNQKCACGGMHF